MKKMRRTSRAVWTGTGAEGSGKVTTGSGALDALPYSVVTRFVSEDGKAGTNPEELIAAAHASCFAMALSFGLTGAGHPPEQLDGLRAVRQLESQRDQRHRGQRPGRHHPDARLGEVIGAIVDPKLVTSNVNREVGGKPREATRLGIAMRLRAEELTFHAFPQR